MSRRILRKRIFQSAGPRRVTIQADAADCGIGTIRPCIIPTRRRRIASVSLASPWGKVRHAPSAACRMREADAQSGTYGRRSSHVARGRNIRRRCNTPLRQLNTSLTASATAPLPLIADEQHYDLQTFRGYGGGNYGHSHTRSGFGDEGESDTESESRRMRRRNMGMMGGREYSSPGTICGNR